jgi:HSP20 family protein
MYCNLSTTEDNTPKTATRALTPRADLYSDDAGSHLVLDLPGIPRENLEIAVVEQRLTITGRRPTADPVGESAHQEIRTGDFHREFTLGQGIDAGRIEAALRDGVLHLRLPFAESLKPRSIPIA